MKRKGFTLIEAMAVVGIIGILATLGTYIAFQAQRQARDTKRKSDLYAISQAFEARFLDRTCTNPIDLSKYPGSSTAAIGRWVEVRTIANSSDCYIFSQYLPTIPADPQGPRYSYYFNLSTIEKNNGIVAPAPGKHYRLAASLERSFAPASPGQQECVRNSGIWEDSFGGQPYDCKENVIGINLPRALFAATPRQEINPDIDPDTGSRSDGGGLGSEIEPPGDSERRDYNYYLGR